jgi:3-hydroxyisobutyrate dehydrogenase-like beta-hydroxyacid dehydrogenase
MTAWNRSPEKMQPFIDDGVAAAPDAASAIVASPVVLVCIDNYVATDAILKFSRISLRC